MLAVMGELSMMLGGEGYDTDGGGGELIDERRRCSAAAELELLNGGEVVPLRRTFRRPGRGDGGSVKMLCWPRAWEGSARACERQDGGWIAWWGRCGPCGRRAGARV